MDPQAREEQAVYIWRRNREADERYRAERERKEQAKVTEGKPAELAADEATQKPSDRLSPLTPASEGGESVLEEIAKAIQSGGVEETAGNREESEPQTKEGSEEAWTAKSGAGSEKSHGEAGSQPFRDDGESNPPGEDEEIDDSKIRELESMLEL